MNYDENRLQAKTKLGKEKKKKSKNLSHHLTEMCKTHLAAINSQIHTEQLGKKQNCILWAYW